MRPILFRLLLFLLSTIQVARAQYAEKDFVLYSVRNGLSDNYVNCLQQDDRGYMWVGTKVGLNRFDGVNFKQFFQNTAPLNLPSTFITRLKKIGPNALGVFSRGGFEVLNTDDYKVSRYIIRDTTAFTTPLNAVWDAMQLPNGYFALSTAAGFYVTNEKGLKYRHDAFNIKDIGRKQILFGREIFTTGNNNYLIYTNEDGQALYNSESNKFTPLNAVQMPWAPFLHPRSYPGDRWLIKKQLSDHEFVFLPIKLDSIVYYNSRQNKRVASALPASLAGQLDWESELEASGNMLLLNSGITGFYRLQLDRTTGHIIMDEKKWLPSYQIKCLLVDKDGRLWAGTSQGLLKQELVMPFISAFNYESSPASSPQDNFTAVYRYKNLLYAGRYSRHHGLTIIDPVTMKRVKQIQFYGNNDPWNEVMSMEMYHPDTLWLGTWAGLLWYDTKSERYGKVLDVKKYPGLTNFPSILAPAGPDGYAWICAYLNGRVLRYHIASHSFKEFSPQTNPALPFEKIKNIVYDSYGDVWISGHALTRWSSRLQRFDTVINVYAGANKFNDDIVSISADNNGSLWIHNADNGLLEYKIRDKRFVAYSMKDGLPSESFGSLSPVIDYRLWMASSHQLCLMDTRNKQFTIYGLADGFPERNVTSRRIYPDPIDSQFYLSAEDDLVRFPFSPEKRKDMSSALVIEDMTINNDSTIFLPDDKIDLKHNQNSLGFHFTVVDFERNSYQFAYRLNNSTVWNPIGEQHSISFNNLSPGKYTIELSATGKPGTRKTATIIITIKPPFWARTWFLLILAALLLAAFYWLFRARLKRVRQKAAIDKQLSQTEMKALQAQMNPHFIFNSLNSIREMILSNENKEASHYLSQFAQLIRVTLEQSTQETVSLRATIDYLHRYIEMEAIRNEFVQYQIEVEEGLELDETMVSPMIIQPFVENAIWHGVSATRKDIMVKISFKKAGESLICTVDDNGMGINHSRSLKKLNGPGRRSHGIANVEDRIKLLSQKYDIRCSVTIVDKKASTESTETGTLVTILLPYQTME